MSGSFILVLLAMFAFMYLLLIRPQRQQQRRHAEMVEALKAGDEVITAGGIYGDVTEVQADRVTLEIAEDVEVEVAKRAIASIVPAEEREVELEEAADEPEPALEAEPATEAKVAEEDTARR